uniref:Acyl-CoA dehydrogenase/oxidase C-terminal domain-containing protein n=1 Tax=Phenylobacterium glaciei TaxID=2803784 RepID=A0A974P4R4_9CAUL|nr:hypothetical protein JKL49_06905 [Phenylobacterium glaciei]
MTGIDLTRRMAELTFDKVAAEPLTGGKDVLARLRDAGWVLLAADTLGACDVMIEKAVAYAKERKQFGRVIGSFQAVKHLCAEMAAELEPCRSLVWYAGYAFDAAPDESSWWPPTPRRTCRRSPASSPGPPPRCTAAWASPTCWACTSGSSGWASTASCWAVPSGSEPWPPRCRA